MILHIAGAALEAVDYNLEDHCRQISGIPTDFVDSLAESEVVGRTVEVSDNLVLKEHNLVVHQLNSVGERLKGKVKRFLEEPVAPDIVDNDGPP